MESSYYRHDIGALRLLVLDGNDEGSPSYDGGYHSYVGPVQQEWLAAELASTTKPVLILSHQPLAGAWAIDNAETIQKLLSQYQSKVILCLNGHSFTVVYLGIDCSI